MRFFLELIPTSVIWGFIHKKLYVNELAHDFVYFIL